MDEHRYDHTYHPWDDSVYGTGPMDPPKKPGGLMALLLVVIIFLVGIISILGLMNVRLFRQLQAQETDTLSISFTTGATVATEPTAATEEIPVSTENFAPIELQQSPQSVDTPTDDGGLSLQEIYSRCVGSVVSISCTGGGSSASGTGVVLTEDGYIVTNCHVVEEHTGFTVRLSDDRQLPATLVGSDSTSDLAVLRVEAENLSPAQFGNSDALRVGDSVAAIGDPLGEEFRGTLTDGIVSAINRDVTVEGRTMTLIQTNAALNSGNSGGPLINCYGQVIGINTMKIGTFTSSSGVEGLGFAIPSTTVKEVVEQLIAQGYVSGRPTLGLTGEGLSSFYQHYYRLPAGLYITSVARGSTSEAGGIQEGDILLSLGDSRITSAEELTTALADKVAGQTVQVTLYRGGRQYLLELTLDEAKG